MAVSDLILPARRVLPLRGAARGLDCEVLPQGAPPGAVPGRAALELAALEWVLQQLVPARHPRVEVTRVALDLSSQTLGDAAFRRAVLALLISSPDSSTRLGLHMTESAAIPEFAPLRDFLQSVRRLGVRVSLDDFGTGPAWYGRLSDVPVDILKIPADLVRGVLEPPLNLVAVRCALQAARILGTPTVADGVESQAVRRRLCELGVDFAQGDLMHRPEPLADLLQVHSRPLRRVR